MKTGWSSSNYHFHHTLRPKEVCGVSFFRGGLDDSSSRGGQHVRVVTFCMVFIPIYLGEQVKYILFCTNDFKTQGSERVGISQCSFVLGVNWFTIFFSFFICFILSQLRFYTTRVGRFIYSLLFFQALSAWSVNVEAFYLLYGPKFHYIACGHVLKAAWPLQNISFSTAPRILKKQKNCNFKCQVLLCVLATIKKKMLMRVTCYI